MVVRAILINATDALGHHGCTLVNRQLESLASGAGIEFVARLPLSADWSRIAPRNFDCVIVNGEGTLHSDSKGARQIAKIPSWAHRYGVPTFLINSIYESNSPEILAGIRKFDKIWVRDDFSQKALSAFGVNSDYVPDLTLSWECTHCGNKQDRVVVQDSTIKTTRDALYCLSTNINSEYVPILGRPSHDVAGGNFRRRVKFFVKRNLYFLLKDVAERQRYKNAVSDFDEFIANLRRTSFLVTGRFHGVTIAACLRIPFIAVSSNSHKMAALLEQMHMSHRLVKKFEEIPAKLDEPSLRRFSSAELSMIDVTHKEAIMKAKLLFSHIKCAVDQAKPSTN